jgi:formamidopyrimidine-DNA glycosylase
MPEGPEIFFYVMLFKQKFVGKELVDIISYVEKNEIDKKIVGMITDVYCKGKTLWFEIDKKHYIQIHLKITGYYSFEIEKNAKYELIFMNEKKQKESLYINDTRGFLSFKILNEEEHNNIINQYGMSIFDNDFSYEFFCDVIKKNKNKMLCGVLFDQKNISGMGNYILNEIFFLSKVNPELKINVLKDSEIELLYNNILFVSYSSLITLLSDNNLKLDKKTYTNIPKKNTLEIPYNIKIYGRKKLDDGSIVKNKKVCGRKMYYL